MKVTCKVEECDIDPEDGRPEVPGVCATCSRCGHESTAYGTGDRSIRRALVGLRDDCPEDEENYYVDDDGSGESRMPEPAVKPWWQR